MKLRKEIIQYAKIAAKEFSLPIETVLAFITVETPARGFDLKTGKILIQFEPVWLRKLFPRMVKTRWALNGVEEQEQEWIAFNDAYAKNPIGAMQATSIGLGQILGLHYKRLGYATVGQMWDEAKQGELNQIRQLCKFIVTDKRLLQAVITGDTHKMAYYYNGAGYQALAKKLGREPYNISLAKAIAEYKKTDFNAL